MNSVQGDPGGRSPGATRLLIGSAEITRGHDIGIDSINSFLCTTKPCKGTFSDASNRTKSPVGDCEAWNLRSACRVALPVLALNGGANQQNEDTQERAKQRLRLEHPHFFIVVLCAYAESTGFEDLQHQYSEGVRRILQFSRMRVEHLSLRNRRRRVCIIGAGVSGLRCAGLLAAEGFEVSILEARDRVGGRIHQTSRFGLPIDLGACWIHGTQGNPIVDLADKAKSTTVPYSAVYSICRPDGAWLSCKTARHYYEEVWEILQMAMNKSHEEAASLSDLAKMMGFFCEEVRRRRSQTRQPEAYEHLMMQIVEMWGAFMGNECQNQSLKNLWLDGGLDGDNLFMASTYKDIVTGLLSPVSNNATIRLGCEVTRIANSPNGSLRIEAADGFGGSFDDVVVTAPLGWLKRHESVFSPPLTPKISTAIHSLGYGNLDRVFIKFPSAFWNAQVSKSNGHHGGTAKETQSPAFPVESLFLRPKYATDTNPARWRQEIISFSGLPKPFSLPVIMFFVYGQWGRHVTGLVRGMDQGSEEFIRILNNNFQPYYSKLPNYDPASPDCKPLEFMSTDWQGDKFAGFGSYTNLPVGSGDCQQHFEALREGLGNERGIWFAGEHTSPPGGLGTVTGAYWSGEEAAKRVAGRHELTMAVPHRQSTL